jgi:hypothetical protein
MSRPQWSDRKVPAGHERPQWRGPWEGLEGFWPSERGRPYLAQAPLLDPSQPGWSGVPYPAPLYACCFTLNKTAGHMCIDE